MARFLRPRGFGDVDTEAVVMVALLSRFGARERPPATVDAAAHIIEHGLLGQPAPGPPAGAARRRSKVGG